MWVGGAGGEGGMGIELRTTNYEQVHRYTGMLCGGRIAGLNECVLEVNHGIHGYVIKLLLVGTFVYYV